MNSRKISKAINSILEGKDIRKTIAKTVCSEESDSFYENLSNEYVRALTKKFANAAGLDFEEYAENEPFAELYYGNNREAAKGRVKNYLSKYDMELTDAVDDCLVYSFADSGKITNANIKTLFPDIDNYL